MSMTKAEQQLFIALADAVEELAYNWPQLSRLKTAIVDTKQEIAVTDAVKVDDVLPTIEDALPVEEKV